MENRANYALVGLFTLAVIVGIFSFVYWFKRAGENGDRKSYRVVFTGSISGLSRGSLVRFNGLRVGEVVTVDIMPSDPSKVLAVIEVDKSTPIRTDTKARLEYQGLTGVAWVQLTGVSATAPELSTNDPSGSPIIFADRSDYQDILETVQRLSGKFDSVLVRADSILSQAEGPLITGLRNVETFSRALSDNSAVVSDFLVNAGAMSQKVASLSARIEKFVDETDSIFKVIDPTQVQKIIDNLVDFSDTLNANKQSINDLFRDSSILVKNLNVSVGTLQGTLEGAKQFTDALGKNSDSVDKALQDITKVTEKARLAADRLDNVLAGAEKFLGDGQNGSQAGFMQEISQAAKSIRKLADNLDQRTAEISKGLNHFSGSGLRDFEALANESRKTVADFSRFLRSFEQNPQQLILGNRPALPDYHH